MASLVLDLLRGAAAGAVATWLMDLTTTGLLEGQSKETTEQEEAARPKGQGTVPNFVDRLDQLAGLSLDQPTKDLLGQGIHYGLGIAPAALYAVLRRRLPLVGAGRGSVYGLLLWAVNDELLNTVLGLSGPIEAYPAETHWRGLVGHVVLGVATDVGIDLLGGQASA